MVHVQRISLVAAVVSLVQYLLLSMTLVRVCLQIVLSCSSEPGAVLAALYDACTCVPANSAIASDSCANLLLLHKQGGRRLKVCSETADTLNEMFKGANIVVEGDEGWYYNWFKQMQDAYARTSSHYRSVSQIVVSAAFCTAVTCSSKVQVLCLMIVLQLVVRKLQSNAGACSNS
jgi:hypothetical protein